MTPPKILSHSRFKKYLDTVKQIDYDCNMKISLNTNEIQKMRQDRHLTWSDIAKLGGLKSRQHAYDKLYEGSVKNAVFFAKIFKCKPKDLII